VYIYGSYESVRFVYLHKSRTFGPSETNGITSEYRETVKVAKNRPWSLLQGSLGSQSKRKSSMGHRATWRYEQMPTLRHGHVAVWRYGCGNLVFGNRLIRRGLNRYLKLIGARWSQEEPGAARESPEQPGAMRSHEEPRRATKSEEEPGGARRSQEQPGKSWRSQEKPGKAWRSLAPGKAVWLGGAVAVAIEFCEIGSHG
jgi:hypothetical protein